MLLASAHAAPACKPTDASARCTLLPQALDCVTLLLGTLGGVPDEPAPPIAQGLLQPGLRVQWPHAPPASRSQLGRAPLKYRAHCA